jgi:multiple sugar transport system permease protein
MVYYIFQRAFVNNQGGRAAAIAVVLFIMVIIISVINFQLMRLSERRK